MGGSRGGKRFREEFSFALKLGKTCVHEHMMKRKNQKWKKGKSEKKQITRSLRPEALGPLSSNRRINISLLPSLRAKEEKWELDSEGLQVEKEADVVVLLFSP